MTGGDAERSNTVHIIKQRFSPPPVTQSSTCSVLTAPAEKKQTASYKTEEHEASRRVECRKRGFGIKRPLQCVAAIVAQLHIHTRTHTYTQTHRDTEQHEHNLLTHQVVQLRRCCRRNAVTKHTPKGFHFSHRCIS